MGDFSSGAYQGIQDSNARHAASQVSSLSSEVSSLESRLREAKRAAEMKQELLLESIQINNELREKHRYQQAHAAMGYTIMNAFLRSMEEHLTPAQFKVIRTRTAELAIKRMQEEDAEDRKNGWCIDITDNFLRSKKAELLGVVPQKT